MPASGASSPRLPTLLLGAPIAVLTVLVSLALGLAVLFGGAGSCEASPTGTVSGVPARLVPIYQRAAARYGLGEQGPAILAAINWNESSFGTNMATSEAGAQGWMAFLPESWDGFGVDANGDGVKDPYDPWDAIFAAARLLRYLGAPGNWHDAIYGYNHAEWYVAKVLADARRFGGGVQADVAIGTACAAAASGPAVGRMVAEADRIDALRLTYVWGGSHGLSPTPANGPFDCSSAVSHLLQVAGFGNPTMDTTALIAWGEAGRGRLVTIHVKPYGPQAHTFIEFAPSETPPSERYWGTSRTNPGGGPGWIPESAFSAGYLAGFQLRHPPGL